MGSLINNIDKESLESVFDDIHDTFARDIKFIKDAQKIILSTDPNYNYLYKYGLCKVYLPTPICISIVSV